MKILITGVAGFIGSATAVALLKEGHTVIGVDRSHANSPDSQQIYDDRLALLEYYRNRFKRHLIDLSNTNDVIDLSDYYEHDIDAVIHLAAKAGVRGATDDTAPYIRDNIVAFDNLLSKLVTWLPPHVPVIYASSSSVYGNARCADDKDRANEPLSIYAATKKANEMMAHVFAHRHKREIVGLRFFTVYGPWGRPDMAVYKFMDRLTRGDPIIILGDGSQSRTYTYINDAVRAILAVLECWEAIRIKRTELSTVYDVGSNNHCTTLQLAQRLSAISKIPYRINFATAHPADVQETVAESSRIAWGMSWVARTCLDDGLAEFVRWYQGYHK